MGRDAISRTEHDGVTGHELACRDAHLDPVADGMPDRRCHFAQGLERAFGAELLDEAEKDREQDDHGDHHGLERVPEQPRNEGCDEQDDHQDVLELGREGAPRGALRERLQLVRPMDGQPAARLLGTQAIVLCRQPSQDIGNVQAVPAHGSLGHSYVVRHGCLGTRIGLRAPPAVRAGRAPANADRPGLSLVWCARSH